MFSTGFTSLSVLLLFPLSIHLLYLYVWFLILFHLTWRLAITAKGFLKLPNLHMLIKEKSQSLPTNLSLGTFSKLLNNWRCCLLHLTKQNCLLKTFLKTPILMTRVSFFLFSTLELIRNCIIRS